MVHLKLQFLIVLIILENFTFAGPQKIHLSVYYESKCPDSKLFILKQLLPAFHLLHDYLKLSLIPFGKARSINYGDGGFECQHGSAECLGNIVQDCSLHQMKGQSDKKKLAYVVCEMHTEAASQGRFDCVERSNLSTEHVEKCVTSGEGTILQLESEYHTGLVNPKFVPTVTINGEFNQEIQDYAQVDLIGTLCSLLIDSQPCGRYYNYIALNNLMNTSPRNTH
ncbi:gamma-interferon-inducible lysosomal thiol reductase-like [Vanessa atalanta]|uniref:gamma-interferon-inducible lysosomal thiol reductase-like n=1 Tax=Vanessa atalanta TaxID=42275 RepID=UPI001FCDD240|nr:gamma-interferon-inducible lysosomal thiol reductase-like [Vanessa atalanta]